MKLKRQNSKYIEFKHSIDIKHVQEKGQLKLKQMLGEDIENTFKKARQITMQMRHPTKKHLKPAKIYKFQPDFPILHMQLASIKPDQKYKRKK